MAGNYVLRNGYKTVTTAGTQEQLIAEHIKTRYLVITAELSNTNNIYIGDSDVSSTNAFIQLDSAQKMIIDLTGDTREEAVIDLYDIWVDADTNTEGVYFGYLQEVNQ